MTLQPADSRRLHVLLAEDNAVNQMLVKGILQRHGHQVVLAKTGVEVLAALERQPVDAVLMDVQMPELDGCEATIAIRKHEAAGRVFARNGTGRLPIIAMTAQSSDDDRQQCFDSGMDDYIAKPVEPNVVLRTLDGAVFGGSSVVDPHASAPPVDRRALEALVGEKPERLRTLIETFLTEADQLVSRIDEALAAGDPALVRRAAHSLKGAVSIFGAPAATTAAQRLESLGEAGTLSNAPAARRTLEEELKRLRPVLAELLRGV